MKELQIGQIITGRRANYVRPRIAALTLLSFAVAFGLSRTGTTTMTITHAPVKSSNQTKVVTKTGGAGGGGTIHAH